MGGGATAVSYLLPRAIGAFRREHPDVRFEVREAGTDRAGELFVHLEPGYKVSSPFTEGPSNPLPGNHGHAATRHIMMLVTGGWVVLAVGATACLVAYRLMLRLGRLPEDVRVLR